MQNISKRREDDYRQIVGERYIGPLRSILKAEDGCMLVWADFQGAELHALGVLSNDTALLEHVRRNSLPEDDPQFYDLHSQIAVTSFRLQCEPTKAGLKSVKKVHLRIVAKSIIFGLAYGRGAAAIAEAVKEEGVYVTVEEVQQVMDTIKATYPAAMKYLDTAADRVNQPGWMAGVCKRYRRIPKHGYMQDDKAVALGRVFKNYGPQNYVAESMNKALRNLFDYRLDREDGLDYQLLLQVHDEVLLQVPYEWVPAVVDTVLPRCMRDAVAIYSRGLDGVLDKTRGPYRMSVDITVGFSYGIGLSDWRETCEKLLKERNT
jgi:DNA polymerase I-like protein with 3'-5' exonuclease and polymerase domains